MSSESNVRRVPRLKRSEVISWAGEQNIESVPPDTLRAWKVGDAAKLLLSDVGLPRFTDLFVPQPQRTGQPFFPPYYILGREDEEHPHGQDINLECGCGYFGLREHDDTVWQLFPGDKIPPLMVNSSLAQFLYFLHVLGSAQERYKELPDREMIPQYEKVIRRLIKWDVCAVERSESFWGYKFERPWG